MFSAHGNPDAQAQPLVRRAVAAVLILGILAASMPATLAAIAGTGAALAFLLAVAAHDGHAQPVIAGARATADEAIRLIRPARGGRHNARAAYDLAA